MPDKNPDKPAKLLRKGTNVSLHPIKKDRGLQVLREFGYELSDGIDAIFEKLWEARQQFHGKKRPDRLQLTFFDLNTPPNTKEKKK